MIKFFVLDGLFSWVVAVSPDSAPDSAFAPSFSARPSGPLPSPIIRCPTGRARLKSALMSSSRAYLPNGLETPMVIGKPAPFVSRAIQFSHRGCMTGSKQG